MVCHGVERGAGRARRARCGLDVCVGAHLLSVYRFFSLRVFRLPRSRRRFQRHVRRPPVHAPGGAVCPHSRSLIDLRGANDIEARRNRRCECAGEEDEEVCGEDHIGQPLVVQGPLRRHCLLRTSVVVEGRMGWQGADGVRKEGDLGGPLADDGRRMEGYLFFIKKFAHVCVVHSR